MSGERRGWLLLALGLIAGLAWAGLAWPNFGGANLALLLLLPVVVAASGGGRRAGIAIALIAGAVFNFVSLEPRLTFHIARAGDLLTLGIYALVAFFTASVASRLAEAGERARADARAGAASSKLAQRLLSTSDPAKIRAAAAEAIGRSSGYGSAVVETPEALDYEDPSDEAAARWALAHRDLAGRGVQVLPSAPALYLASHAGRRALLARIEGPVTDPSVLRQLRTFVDEAADALDRVDLAARVDADMRHAETEAMREAIFASIGHDLRTPMASLRAGLEGMQVSDQEQLHAVRKDALRLERTLENLLELARLQARREAPERAVIDLTDTIASAIDALPADTRERIAVRVAPETPLVASDAVILHHIVVNLLENAAKYSPAGTPIELFAKPDGSGGAELAVADRGPGIGEDAADLFALFQRGENADSAPGSGVGLSVVDAFSRALGHTVKAADRKDGQGAEFTLVIAGVAKK